MVNYLDKDGLTRLWSKIKAYVNEYTGLTPEGVIDVAHGGTGKATHTSNAVLTGNGTSAVNNIATASGALYATSTNGVPKFGTLPITQGGTGRTTAPSMLVNLASTTAASPLIASPRPGVTGTLPIARGGTEATTAAEALANLGGLSMELIWQNASPTSTFAAQSISISNLQNYSKILVIARYSTGSNNGITAMFDTATGALGAIIGAATYTGWRNFTVKSNAIQFDGATYRTTYGGGVATDNAYFVPVEIYGIKGVQS